ncbi:MAG TPA: hypothetical protein VGN07_00310 [Steroidobacteraceae bacterium]
MDAKAAHTTNRLECRKKTSHRNDQAQFGCNPTQMQSGMQPGTQYSFAHNDTKPTLKAQLCFAFWVLGFGIWDLGFGDGYRTGAMR